MIEIRHLRKEYEEATPLKDVNVVIPDGDIISVIGPSGTGKSTLLRCINMLEKPTSGQILINGADVTAAGCDLGKIRRNTGMVFQSFNLFNHLRVIENIMLAQVDLLGRSRQEAYDEAVRLLKVVGLSEKKMHYPDELSGGQKQRVAIARTLAMKPDTILLDEPTSALDPAMSAEVEAVIRDLAKTGKTLMIATHDMNFARAISTRVFYMDEGGIYEDGPPEQIFDHPQKDNTRRFILRLRVLEFDIHDRHFDFYGMLSRIIRYCEKNQISGRVNTHLQLAFEETVQQMLLPALEETDIHISIEYSGITQSAAFTVCYGGKKTDITAQEDRISYSVLKGVAKNIQYSYDPEDTLPNKVTMTVI